MAVSVSFAYINPSPDWFSLPSWGLDREGLMALFWVPVLALPLSSCVTVRQVTKPLCAFFIVIEMGDAGD